MRFIPPPLIKINYLGVDLYVKRDDLFPISGGGNKGRKAEYILAQAVKQQCNAVVTCGGEQSNHVRATAIRCKELGLACTIVIHAKKPNEVTGNLKLLYLLGVTVVYCDMADVSDVMDAEMNKYIAKGNTPYYIWGGGHCIEGTQAYVDAAFEVQKQLDTQFDFVFHASGTGATQAGLHLGFKQINESTQVIGISVARKNPRGVEAVTHSALEFINANDLSTKLSADIKFDDNFIAGGYEESNDNQLTCIKNVAEQTGVILDPTYSGKAWYGMEQYIKSGKVKAGSKVLFWHTGGLLNLMASKLI